MKSAVALGAAAVLLRTVVPLRANCRTTCPTTTRSRQKYPSARLRVDEAAAFDGSSDAPLNCEQRPARLRTIKRPCAAVYFGVFLRSRRDHRYVDGQLSSSPPNNIEPKSSSFLRKLPASSPRVPSNTAAGLSYRCRLRSKTRRAQPLSTP